MDARTARALRAINRRFYAHHAASFSRTRSRPWRGWERLLELAAPDPAARLRVADLGCGNGRFGEFLASARPGELDYVGVDASEKLLAVARQKLPDVDLVCADLLEADLGALLGERRFDLVVLLGVYHHVPGYEERRRLLEACGKLLAPGGTLAVTIWGFEDPERLERKRVPWEAFEPAPGEEIDLGELEEGDHLLSWQGESDPPRYCHLASEEEIEQLLAELSLQCRERWRDDRSAGGTYNEYVLFSL